MIKKTFFDEQGNKYEAKVFQSNDENGQNFAGFLHQVENIQSIEVIERPKLFCKTIHTVRRNKNIVYINDRRQDTPF